MSEHGTVVPPNVAEDAVRETVVLGGEDYRWLIMRQLIENRVALQGISEHLARLNGSVAEHAISIRATEKRQAAREQFCPLVDATNKTLEGALRGLQEKLDEVLSWHLATVTAQETRSSIWKQVLPWLQPIVIALGAAILTLLVTHAKDVFKK